MNEVKPLFDKNKETIYIATEANVKPMYTSQQMREYRSELVDYIYEIHKSPSFEERLEKAVKEFVKEIIKEIEK